MSDNRSRLDKLRAMAAQTTSPQEAAIAQRILDELGDRAGNADDLAASLDRIRATAKRAGADYDSFAAAAGRMADKFRVTRDATGRPIEVIWTGDDLAHAPLGEMLRRLRQRELGGGQIE